MTSKDRQEALVKGSWTARAAPGQLSPKLSYTILRPEDYGRWLSDEPDLDAMPFQPEAEFEDWALHRAGFVADSEGRGTARDGALSSPAAIHVE